MFRLTRPLYQAVRKTTTGLTGLSVHPDPLPVLTRTYEQTLSALSALPAHSVYRQGAEALTQRKLALVQAAKGSVEEAERTLDDGQIEEALGVAEDELRLAGKMAEWKPCVLLLRAPFARLLSLTTWSLFGLQVGTAGGEGRARAVGVLWVEGVRSQPYPTTVDWMCFGL